MGTLATMQHSALQALRGGVGAEMPQSGVGAPGGQRWTRAQGPAGSRAVGRSFPFTLLGTTPGKLSRATKPPTNCASAGCPSSDPLSLYVAFLRPTRKPV